MRDPYEVLGVSRSASDAEIKRAYRRLAKECHPDRHGGDPRAQARLAEINAAYELLHDREKRRRFDRGEIDAEGKPRHPGFGGFGRRSREAGFDADAFADIFAGFGGHGQRSGFGGTRTFRFAGGPGGSVFGFEATGAQDDVLRSMFEQAAGQQAERARPASGADVRAEVAVTLEEVVGGRRPRVTLPTGRTVELKLPRGVTDGQTIRLKGQGRSLPAGGPPGDALVTVRLVPHPRFRVQGADLTVDVAIGLDQAVLGGKVAVPTPSGRVQVNVPPGLGAGRTLRIKGKGLPKPGGSVGDLLVTLRVEMPDGPDPDLEALMRRWRAEGRGGNE